MYNVIESFQFKWPIMIATPITSHTGNSIATFHWRYRKLPNLSAESNEFTVKLQKKNLTHPKASIATRSWVTVVATPVIAKPRPSPDNDWSKKYHNPKLSIASVMERWILLSNASFYKSVLRKTPMLSMVCMSDSSNLLSWLMGIAW